MPPNPGVECDLHRATGFDEPESDTVIDFGFRSARDFAPERARGDNVYEAAADHFKKIAKAGKRPLLAAYSNGSRQRIASILGEAGTYAMLGRASSEECRPDILTKPVPILEWSDAASFCA